MIKVAILIGLNSVYCLCLISQYSHTIYAYTYMIHKILIPHAYGTYVPYTYISTANHASYS